MSGYPINLNLNGRTVLVVGLGPVGRRKAAALVAAGARVIGVDPVAGSLDPDSVAGIELVSEPYCTGQLRGVSLVIAAGPSEINRQVVADARRIGVWVSSSSDPDEGDFTVPAVWRSGPLVLTVSTSGASPALLRAPGPGCRCAGTGCGRVDRDSGRAAPLVLDRLADPRARQRILHAVGGPSVARSLDR